MAMNKFNINNFVLDKVVEVIFYKAVCPVCGYENVPIQSINHVNKTCPQCGKDLYVGTTKERIK